MRRRYSPSIARRVSSSPATIGRLRATSSLRHHGEDSGTRRALFDGHRRFTGNGVRDGAHVADFVRVLPTQPASGDESAGKDSRAVATAAEHVAGTIQGFGVVAPIFAWVETTIPKRSRKSTFTIHWARSLKQTNYAGSGSGSGSIKSILSFLERWGKPKPAEMTLTQATVLANRLLMTAAEFDTATGGVHPRSVCLRPSST